MEELRPCPFCGNSSRSTSDLQRVAIVEYEKNTIGYGLPAASPIKVYYVRCGQCYARTGNTTTGRNLFGTSLTEEQARQIAINKWNQRAREVAV